MISKKGINRWLRAKPSDVLPDSIICERCGSSDFRWETDSLDTEFILAMSYRTISPRKKDSSLCADICLGSDSHNEKWFQFSLIPSIAIEGSPPFKSALIHVPVVNGDGKEIFRAEDGSAIVQEILNNFGADVLRFWVTSMNCRKHLKLSDLHIEMVSKTHRRIMNICRFLINNLSGYDPENDRVDYKCLQAIDRWALHRLARLVDEATKALEDFQFHCFYRLVRDFCLVDMSSLYLNIVRRRLYTFPRWSSGRRAVQTVIYEILTSLAKLMAPVLSFTAEEIWRHIPGAAKEYPSVYLSQWPDVKQYFMDSESESGWDRLLRIRSEIYKLLEKHRQGEGISNPSQASLILYASSADTYDLLDKYIDDLEAILMVSRVRLMSPDDPIPDGIWRSDSIEGLAVEVRRASGERCERCRIYSDTVGTNEQYPTLCYRCIGILEGGTYYI